ncbi:amidohydrolase [Enterococcus sp. MMGLQ5-1]|uniref:amidohydrolase n=1 Tax=Enterococcus sp. MMGLQ5-1 TaxID=2737663 RepID=UPI0015558DF5|nr:amidohydrolase [Enterococcus sp. MMGLQ5-1]MBS7583927.1 amidohydrolase [Enterococcus sp. MMGLQ5-1]NPD11788.1 amidohydrolase [Enterococcus sp. MMGLQ5-1]
MLENWQTFEDELVKIRHQIHQNPELSNQEFETTKLIKNQLDKWHIKIVDTVLKTGVIAEIGDGSNGATIALRADIDALPIIEKTGLAYSSKNIGVMHACGHDFHLTSLLGAARLLKANEGQLNGLVRLIFQPAEENYRGALKVIKAGHLKDVKAIIGDHNHPQLLPGEIGLITGGIMAAVDQFMVKIIGVGTHAANPHLGKDVIVAMSQMINQLQAIVARNVSPADAVVISVTRIEAGNTWNVLPDTAVFEGTIRSFSNQNRQYVKDRFSTIVKQTAEIYDVSTSIRWIEGPGVTNNDIELTNVIVANSKKFAKVFKAAPSNGGEDFADYQAILPGVFAFIGSNGKPNASGWHHSDFTVRDEGLKTAVLYYVENSYRLLEYFDEK